MPHRRPDEPHAAGQPTGRRARVPARWREAVVDADGHLVPERLGDYVDRLNPIARSLCRSRHDAEDLVQETLARVLARPRRLRNADALAYLVRALRNTFHDLHGRHGPMAAELHEQLIESGAGVGFSSEESISSTREVLRAVAELPADFRDLVVAVDLIGFSYADAARSFAIPTGTVMSRLHRARRRVMRRLALT
jgi:RNA polymerase sigma-70 factor, ECF subfamily